MGLDLQLFGSSRVCRQTAVPEWLGGFLACSGGCQDRGAACPHSFIRVWGNQQDPGEREKLGESWGRIDLGINEGRQKMEGERNGPRQDKRGMLGQLEAWEEK